MNDNDIIRAFECCNTRTLKCEDCPYLATQEKCRHTIKDMIALAKRQKEEIEELQKENLELKDGYFQKRYEEIEHQELMGLREAWRKSTDQNMDLQLEIERLQNDLGIWKDVATRETSYVSIAKTEAIKGFAEKLKEDSKSFFVSTAFLEYIDDLVKEMTEGEDVEK